VADRKAWVTSGIEQVTPTIHRIPLSLPNDALQAVNVYTIQGDGGVGLVDGGWFRPGALDELGGYLAELDLALDDISTVLTTHYHPDHYTLAVELRRHTGCAVALGEGDRETVEIMMRGDPGLVAFGSMLSRCGVPQEFIDRHLRSGADESNYELPSSWLSDGDRPKAGGREFLAIATPGHTRGHFCFADDEAGLLFAGDHVLPHITPSIGYEALSERERHLPLADYLASLRRVRERPDARLLPAHGPIAPSVHDRVDELLAHHDFRLGRCADALAAGARTTYEVAQRIPWTSRDRAYSELSPMDQLMAAHETQAHLEVLQTSGRVRRLAGDEVDEYTLT
jgi:glyoxylase-like metal-dependent hydrolase (beta-lactamase superfamily II)